MSKGKALTVERLQGQLGIIGRRILDLEGQRSDLEGQINQARQSNTNNQTNANTKATFPTWYYYAIGAVAFILIAVLVYFFVYRKKGTTTSSSPPATAVVVEPKKDTPVDAKKEKDSPVEEMFPETAPSSSLPEDYQIFKSVADTKKALGLSDKKDKVTMKDYKNVKSVDAVGVIDGKLRINDTCIKKDKDNDFKLVKCTDVLGTPAVYEEATKMLKNGTRCLYYDKELKMDTKCKENDSKYQWTKASLPSS